jgi:hypothetical protein
MNCRGEGSVAKMVKVKIKEYQYKRSDGFVETKLIAYTDVTKNAKNIFGDIVKKAIVVVDEYDEMKGSKSEWRDFVKVEYDVGNENVLNVDSSVAYITFINGKCVKFYSSEWGTISGRM